jgi:hypothetical protein
VAGDHWELQCADLAVDDIIRACERDDRVRLDEPAPGRRVELLELHGSIGQASVFPGADRSSRSEVPELA